LPAGDSQPDFPVTAVVLGAGFGRRFGSDKRWHVLPSERTLLAATLARYRQAFDDVIVVLRPEDARRVDELERESMAGEGPSPLTVVYCRDAAKGMGHSLSAGAQAVADDHGLFVGLGDMPFVRADTLRELRNRLAAAVAGGDRQCIVQPVHAGAPATDPRGGHPVGFGPGFLAELRRCRGDRGAQHLLRAAGRRVLRPVFDDPGLVRDVDAPEDLPEAR